MHTKSSHYRPDIDGLRAIAILAVLAFHTFPERFRGGFAGVDIFFVISGFLITGIIIRDCSANTFNLLAFYGRRVRRIFPALIFVLASSLVLGWLLLLAPEYMQLGKHTAAAAGFVSNFAFWAESGYFDNAAEAKPLLHLWSLSIEEQFYLFHPLLIYSFRKHLRRLLILIILAIAVSLIWSIHLAYHDVNAAFYSPFSRFWELMIGALVAVTAASWNSEKFTQMWQTRFPVLLQRRNAIRLLYQSGIFSIVGLSLLFHSIQKLSKDAAFPGFWALLPTIGTALVIASPQSTWINRQIFSNRILVWFGLISFPLYLWHWVLLSFPRIIFGEAPNDAIKLVAIACSIFLAWLTLTFIERPLRSGGHSVKKTALLAILAIFIGCAGLTISCKGGFATRSAANLVQKNWGDTGHEKFHAFAENNFPLCTPAAIRDKALKWANSTRCLQSKTGLPVDTVLLGDSHAEHLFIGLAENLPKRNIAFYIRGALPLTDEPEFRNIFAHLKADTHIRDVLIAAYWLHRGVPEPSMRLTVNMLQEAGKRVAIIDDVPDFLFDPSTCQYDRVFRNNKCSQKREDYKVRSHSYFSALRKLSEVNSQLTFISVLNSLCDTSDCYMSRDGTLLYRDRHHLNINGSRYVGSLLSKHTWFTSH